ncbi:MAG TPA: hypothetical protein VHE09_10985 [Rhizomicrobium sp.]|jgi:hypothetical protein|nr:hypothetical protein [Rhizomicrobium sp.]
MLKGVNSDGMPDLSPRMPSVSAISVSEVACEATRALVQAWKKWRGWHLMPPYRAWIEADLDSYHQHASVARVIDDGRDYEFEFIGDAHVRAYGVNHQGRRVSDIARYSPRFGKQLKASYDLVRISGHPHAFQGAIGDLDSSARFVWFETAYLPLGSPGSVDWVLNAAVYRLREA